METPILKLLNIETDLDNRALEMDWREDEDE
jgi:hypothetical protein